MAQHEFSEEQNRDFDALADSLRKFAIGVGALSVLMLAYSIFGVVRGHFGGTTLLFLIGGSALALVLVYMFTRPLDNLRRITTQKGNDMTELSTAINDLSAAHNMFRLLIGLWIVIEAAAFYLKATA